MAKQKLPPASDWKERKLENWNTTTFIAYMQDMNQEKYNLPYTPFAGIMAEKRMLKLAQEEMGNQVLKELIDLAFKEKKQSERNLCLNYGFIHTYMKPSLYPRIIKKIQEEEETRKREENKVIKSKEELKKFF
jgi:hypothetical protein